MQVLRKIQIGFVAAVLGASGCASFSPVGELADRAPIDAQPIALADNEVRVTDNVIVLTDGSGTQYVNETFPEAKALTQSFADVGSNDSTSTCAESRTTSKIRFPETHESLDRLASTKISIASSES